MLPVCISQVPMGRGNISKTFGEKKIIGGKGSKVRRQETETSRKRGSLHLSEDTVAWPRQVKHISLQDKRLSFKNHCFKLQVLLTGCQVFIIYGAIWMIQASSGSWALSIIRPEVMEDICPRDWDWSSSSAAVNSSYCRIPTAAAMRTAMTGGMI